MKRRLGSVWAGLALLATFVGGFSLTHRQVIPTQRILADGGAYKATAPLRDGAEVVLVYVGASGCAWSNGPELPGVVERLKVLTQAKARAAGFRFMAFGIAKDLRVKDGLRHLSSFGDFDEVATGRGALNSGVLRYVFRDIPGQAATPQVLVTLRQVDYGGVAPNTRDERLLLRKVGLTEILEWERAGGPIPLLLEPPGFARKATEPW